VIGHPPEALARRCGWLYLDMASGEPRQRGVVDACSPGWSPMAPPVSTQQLPGAFSAPRGLAPALVFGGAGLGAVLLLGALGLWLHYGTAVFFETIASGLSACF
jgi:hypothetical protein